MDTFSSINIAIEFGAVLLVFAALIGTLALSRKGKYEKVQFALLLLFLGISALSNALYFLVKGREGETIKHG
jgi:di/tricarboxylate transporter